MNIVNSYNPEQKRVLVFVESNLLINYYSNFEGMIKKNTNIDDLRVERTKKNEAMISFPLPEDGTAVKVNGGMSISIPPMVMENITNSINRFTKAAIRNKLKTVEFLPLSEYPVEDLKKDMVAAVRAGRDFVLLQSYKDYLEMEKKGKYSFSQVFVYKGTSEYADTALDIWNEDIEGLKRRLEGKFEVYEWM